MTDFPKPFLLPAVALLMWPTQTSVFAQPSNAEGIPSASVVSSGIISQLLLTTSVKAQSRTICLNTGNRFQTSTQPLEQITMQVPDLVRNATLHFDQIKLNGRFIPLADRKEETPKIGPKYVHLFFDRVRVTDILGTPLGDRLVTLEITFGGGHLLLGSDVVKLLIAK